MSSSKPCFACETVFRLRARLNTVDISAFAADPEDRAFGMRLIEGKRYLRYRLALPAERIVLPPSERLSGN